MWAPLLQIQHVAYAFGVDFHKENCGAVHLRFWASKLWWCGNFAHRPPWCNVCIFAQLPTCYTCFWGRKRQGWWWWGLFCALGQVQHKMWYIYHMCHLIPFFTLYLLHLCQVCHTLRHVAMWIHTWELCPHKWCYLSSSGVLFPCMFSCLSFSSILLHPWNLSGVNPCRHFSASGITLVYF